MAQLKMHEALSWAAPAGQDLRTSLNLFVNMGVDGRLVLPAAGGAVMGTVYEAGNTNEPVTFIFGGVSKVVLAATLTAGQEVQVDAAGKVVALAAGKKVGTLLAGGVANVVVPCRLGA